MTKKNKWIEWVWTAENPYPETLDTMVRIKCNDGYKETKDYNPCPIRYWISGYKDIWEPDHFGSITHYKLA